MRPEVVSKWLRVSLAGTLLAAALTGSALAQSTAVQAADPFDTAFQQRDYATMLALLRPLVEAGEPRAEGRMALMYYQGWGVPRDLDKARTLYLSSAEKGWPRAMYALGRLYQRGDGVAVDKAKALYWLGLAAEAGDRPAALAAGDQAFDMKVYGKAARWLRMAADQGDAKAMFALGLLYADGLGVPKDRPAGFALIRRSAEGGYAFAQAAVGEMYVLGEGGVAPNPAEALAWYSRSAAQGERDGLTGLAEAYALGRGTPVDLAKAAGLYERAADAGVGLAQWRLGQMLQAGRGAPKDTVAAYKWLSLALKANNHSTIDYRASALASLDALAVEMSDDEIARAQALAANWTRRPGD
ncbi:tetratricopeptide repeat protein [Caulobacter segnis]